MLSYKSPKRFNPRVKYINILKDLTKNFTLEHLSEDTGIDT